MHSILWFFTSGVHDPAWVQAVASVALVVLTAVTLAVLSLYAWDTHTLAKMSVRQIKIVLTEDTFQNLRRNSIAYDLIFKANDDLKEMLRSIVEGTFGAKPYISLYPQDWPDASAALVMRKANMDEPMISFGVSLREVDMAANAFLNASNAAYKSQCETRLHKAVLKAGEDAQALVDALKKIGTK